MALNLNRLVEPIYIESIIVHGFGRGSKELGVPTANFQQNIAESVRLDSGIYYGFSQLIYSKDQNLPKQTKSSGSIVFETNPENPIYPTVFSLGWNPHFDDIEHRSLEAHIIKQFGYDFYGSTIRVAICGFIRNEQKFESLQALIETIHSDINFAKKALNNADHSPEWKTIVESPFFYIKKNSI